MSDVERQKITTLAMVRAEHPDIEADDSTFPFSLPTMTGKRPPIFIKLAVCCQIALIFPNSIDE